MPDPHHTKPATRFAYVLLHYEGTPKDEEYVLGSRVLIHSLRLSGTQQDIVVLVSHNVRESTRAAFRTLGAQVRQVTNIPNPYKEAETKRRTWKRRFEFTFNKLYLWALHEYERVIYMDADNLVIHNMDELFLCGHFCAVYFNPVKFHTGVMVVRPNREVFEDNVDALLTLRVYSYDGADQGFLTELYPNLLKAPLFVYKPVEGQSAIDGRPAEDPAMRISELYNMNHVFYYIAFSWDTYRAYDKVFSNETTPFYSLAYPIMPIAKPWYWAATFYFDISWVWNRYRLSMGDDLSGYVMSRIVILLACFVGLPWGWRMLARQPATDPVRKYVIKINSWAPGFFGFVAGGVSLVISWYFAMSNIPMTTPYQYAWSMWFPFRMFGLYMCALVYSTLLSNRRVDGSDATLSPFVVVPGLLAELVSLAIGLLPIHTAFVEKIVVVIFSAIICAVIEIQIFRHAAEKSFPHHAFDEGLEPIDLFK